MLIVMKNRYPHGGAQSFLDLETFRRLDIFQVNSPERGLERLHDRTKMIHLSGIQLDVEDVKRGKFLEEDRLSLHHRFGCERPDIS